MNSNFWDRTESRQGLALPLNEKIILFGAARIDDPIKGFDIFLEALQCLIIKGISENKKTAKIFAHFIKRSYFCTAFRKRAQLGLIR